MTQEELVLLRQQCSVTHETPRAEYQIDLPPDKQPDAERLYKMRQEQDLMLRALRTRIIDKAIELSE